MGLPVSLILIAVGAILAFAVNQSDPNPPVDVDVVGWILMLVGLVGGLLSLMLWDRLGPGAFGWHRGGYAGPPAGDPGYAPRRRTVVEEVEAPPPARPAAALTAQPAERFVQLVVRQGKRRRSLHQRLSAFDGRNGNHEHAVPVRVRSVLLGAQQPFAVPPSSGKPPR